MEKSNRRLFYLRPFEDLNGTGDKRASMTPSETSVFRSGKESNIHRQCDASTERQNTTDPSAISNAGCDTGAYDAQKSFGDCVKEWRKGNPSHGSAGAERQKATDPSAISNAGCDTGAYDTQKSFGDCVKEWRKGNPSHGSAGAERQKATDRSAVSNAGCDTGPYNTQKSFCEQRKSTSASPADSKSYSTQAMASRDNSASKKAASMLGTSQRPSPLAPIPNHSKQQKAHDPVSDDDGSDTGDEESESSSDSLEVELIKCSDVEYLWSPESNEVFSANTHDFLGILISSDPLQIRFTQSHVGNEEQANEVEANEVEPDSFFSMQIELREAMLQEKRHLEEVLESSICVAESAELQKQLQGLLKNSQDDKSIDVIPQT